MSEAPEGTQSQKEPFANLASLGCLAVVIAVLASILFPVFRSARSAATKTACLSNVKQLGLSQILYSTEWDDILPDAWRWMDLGENYMAPDAVAKGIERCPLLPAGSYGYAMNDRLSKAKTSNLSDPAHTILLFESKALRRNLAERPPAKFGEIRHGSPSVAFADGGARTAYPGLKFH